MKFRYTIQPGGYLPAMEIDAAQYALNNTQQMIILGIDFNQVPLEVTDVPGLTYFNLGKLSEQSVITECQARNSLINDGWDFAACPDPELILITKDPGFIVHYKGGS